MKKEIEKKIEQQLSEISNEKCSNVQIFTGATFPHPGTRVHYYIRENPANDAINTENTMAALLARL
ncbi:MAG: hypothetical protein PUD67_02835, partial [Prevotellaceae bacterium]|nr:hypothetical protein [Prevotellaceae bacterium]